MYLQLCIFGVSSVFRCIYFARGILPELFQEATKGRLGSVRASIRRNSKSARSQSLPSTSDLNELTDTSVYPCRQVHGRHLTSSRWMEPRSHRATSLADVSQDVLLLVGEACSDPLAPKSLAHLAATSCQILATLQPKLIELRDFRAEVITLCSKECSRGFCGITTSSLAQAGELSWNDAGLTLADITVLGRLLCTGALPRLGALGLGRNHIDGEGVAALVRGRLKMGALGQLTKLYLFDNQVSDDGIKAFTAAFASGALGKLTFLNLNINQIGDPGMTSLSGAISRGGMRNLVELIIGGNQIGDEGMKAFSAAISTGAMGTLHALGLHGNRISDAGLVAFSAAIAGGATGKLTALLLHENRIGDAGMRSFSHAISNGALAALTNVWMFDNPGDVQLVKVACGERDRGLKCPGSLDDAMPIVWQV